jgi:nucleoside-diphosphate-sugar epimerase
MKILIAGATGIIGRKIIPILIEEGHEVFAMVRNNKDNNSILEMGATPVNGDALERDSVFKVLHLVQPEVVMHQLTSLSSFNLEDNAKIRIVGTRNLVDASKEVGVKKIIAQSLAFTYEPGLTPASENISLDFDAPMPRKINVEGVAALESAVAEMPEYVILRYGFLYGPGTWFEQGGIIAEQIVNQGMKANDNVTSFLSVEDAAQAAVQALQWPNGPVNIVDDEPATAKVWLPVYASMIGAPEPIFEDGCDRGERGALNRKAKEYGWKPMYSTWRTGFKTCLKS